MTDEIAAAAAGRPRRETHASAIRRVLEGEILAGRLLPGTAIDEDALTTRFSVSRTPIREAMLQLIQSGLIEKRSRRGMIVARLTLPRLLHLFETISELEGLCARFATTRISADERETLIAIHDQAGVALGRGDEQEYAHLGRRFHAHIMRATHNEVLIDTTDRLALHTLPFRRFQLRYPGRSQANHHDHGRILEAILAGDGAAAGIAMRRHVTVQGDVLAEYVSIGGASTDE